MSIESYAKIYSVGHNALMGPQNILDGEITIEEKLDGSQFSFGMINGKLLARSKGAQLDIENPEKMFGKAIESIKKISHLLKLNFIYRGEYFQKPKHNVLCYDRIPKDHIIIFDILNDKKEYLSYEDKKLEAERIGLETVPLIYKGDANNIELNSFNKLIDRVSCLGGAKIEGIVIKNYSKLSKDNSVLMGKYVSADFKEVHKNDWKKSKPETSKDVLLILTEEYKTKARYQKAILHLEEAGKLSLSLKDIPLIIKEVQKDIEEECIDEIKEKLYNWAKPYLMRGVVTDVPNWWKEKLLEKQFNTENEQKEE